MQIFATNSVCFVGCCNGRPYVAGLDGGGTPRMPKLLLASAPEHDRRDAEPNGRDDQPKREKRDRIGRSPLPEGFALFCLVMGLLSGLVTFLLLSIGRSISRLPSEAPGPKPRGD